MTGGWDDRGGFRRECGDGGARRARRGARRGWAVGVVPPRPRGRHPATITSIRHGGAAMRGVGWDTRPGTVERGGWEGKHHGDERRSDLPPRPPGPPVPQAARPSGWDQRNAERVPEHGQRTLDGCLALTAGAALSSWDQRTAPAPDRALLRRSGGLP